MIKRITNNSRHYFAEAPMLSSDRLVLKQLSSEHAHSIVDISVYDGVFAKNEADACAILEKIQCDADTGETIHWGIFLKDGNTLAGTCGYYRGYAGNRGEIGYILRPGFTGQGIMTEAVELIVEFGLDILKLSAVIAYTDATNSASIAVLQRVGFSLVTNKDSELKFELRRR